jgi:hypothetical protein
MKMADYNEQVNRLWDEWIAETGQASGDPGDFVEWATAGKRLALRPQDIKHVLRKQITQALRQAKRYDMDGGFHYRSKQSVTLFDDGLPIKHFFDTDEGGSPTLRQRAVRQRREAIAHGVYRAACDVDHMKRVFSGEPKLQFVLDFTDDVAEMRATDLKARGRHDDAA